MLGMDFAFDEYPLAFECLLESSSCKLGGTINRQLIGIGAILCGDIAGDVKVARVWLTLFQHLVPTKIGVINRPYVRP
jgi:hypothetical protein